MSRRVRVCFVCLGNICRSPTAEGVFLHQLAALGISDHVVVDSAGTAGYHTGERADARSRAHAARRGVELPSRARRFDASDFSRFDLVLAMDADNAAELDRRAPNAAARAKIRLFRSYDPSAPPGANVPDPFYGGEAGFEEVLDQCERAAAGLIAALRREGLLPAR